MRSLVFKIIFLILILGYLNPLFSAEFKNQNGSKRKDIYHLKLEEVLRLSLKFNPEIKRIDADLANKLAEATQVQLPSNPEIELRYLSQEADLEGESDDYQYEIEARQSIRLSHLGMRQTYAAAMKETANLEKQAEVIRVLNDTVLLYYRFWMLQKREEILSDSEKQAREVMGRIREAVEKGETPSTEGNLFKAEAIRFGAEFQATQAERMEVQADLLRAIGLPWKEVQLKAPTLSSIPENLFKLLNFAQGRSNLRALVLAKQRAASRRYDVARMDMFPQLTPQFLYNRKVDGSEENWGGGIIFNVPIWDFNQAEIQRARSQKKLADSEAKAFDRLTFDRVIEIRMKRAVALQKKADTYWRDVLPAYRKSYELSRTMFEEGQATMLQLWQVQQKINEVSEAALKNTVDALAARTLLEQALGGKIEEIP